MEDKNIIDGLLVTIKEYNNAYRSGCPIATDEEYDKLVDSLRLLDPDNEWFKHIEPVSISGSRKVKLPIPMKSLDKAKSIDEIKQWAKSLGLKDRTLIVTPKFDGVSLLYDQRTGQAFSRGGTDNEGQDCSGHAAKVSGIMFNTLKPEIHYTYGELVFRVNAWETYFSGRTSAYSGQPYKSPRNTIAGYINRDAPDNDLWYATFFRYGVDEASLDEFDTYEELYRYLCGNYGQPPLYERTTLNDLDEAFLRNCFEKWSQEFYIDGLVIYIDDLELWGMIGRHQTTGNPKYAIAYKNPNFTPVFKTTVKSINWKVSKSGALKPVVNIQTVDTGDCSMENPTGYNAKYIFEQGLGPGAIIEVTRSGGIIPKILKTAQEAPADVMIEQREDLLYCPSCGEPTKWNDTLVELICTNPKCPGINLAKICHFFNTLEAEQMGEETISKLIKAGYNTIGRILNVTFDELMMIDTFGDSIANTILNTNKRIKEGVEVTKLMHSSDCFPGIGQTKAKSILSSLSEVDRFAFVNGLATPKPEFEQSIQFMQLSKTMQTFIRNIPVFYKFISDNGLAILPMEPDKEPGGDKYAGMKVCFSGIRDKTLEEDIVFQGGSIVSGVSKNTTHLIVADKDSRSSKATKAKELGIPIMTIDEFLLL